MHSLSASWWQPAAFNPSNSFQNQSVALMGSTLGTAQPAVGPHISACCLIPSHTFLQGYKNLFLSTAGMLSGPCKVPVKGISLEQSLLPAAGYPAPDLQGELLHMMHTHHACCSLKPCRDSSGRSPSTLHCPCWIPSSSLCPALYPHLSEAPFGAQTVAPPAATCTSVQRGALLLRAVPAQQ